VDLSTGFVHIKLEKTDNVAHRVALQLNMSQIQVGGVYQIVVSQHTDTVPRANFTIVFLDVTGDGYVYPSAATDAAAITFDTTSESYAHAVFELRAFTDPWTSHTHVIASRFGPDVDV
jgi:hypothetical protein